MDELALEGERLSADAHAAQRQGRLAQIKGEGQRQAAPAPVNDLQQPQRDDGLRPRKSALIGLGGMVEAALTGKHLGAGLRIDRVVQHQQQAPVGEGGGDRPPEHRPDPRPRQLHRSHEGVILRLADHHAEECGDGAQQVGGARGGDRQQDRLQRENEPAGAFSAVIGVRKKALELGGEYG